MPLFHVQAGNGPDDGKSSDHSPRKSCTGCHFRRHGKAATTMTMTTMEASIRTPHCRCVPVLTASATCVRTGLRATDVSKAVLSQTAESALRAASPCSCPSSDHSPLCPPSVASSDDASASETSFTDASLTTASTTGISGTEARASSTAILDWAASGCTTAGAADSA